MDTLKRVFNIQNSTWHSLIKGKTNQSLILNYRDTTEEAVLEFLTSHSGVEFVTTVFKAEEYVIGKEAVDIITAFVTLREPRHKQASHQASLSPSASISEDSFLDSISDKIQQQTSIQWNTESVSDQQLNDSSLTSDPDMNSSQQDSETEELPGASPLASDPSPLTPEVQAAITKVLTEYSNQQLLDQFRQKYKFVTVKNVLSIPKFYVKCFSSRLRTAYFTLRRKAKQLLKQPKTCFKPIEVTKNEVVDVQENISPFAKRMIEKMTSGEVVNTMFSFDYQSHRLLQRMNHEHQSLLRYLRTHVRGTPVYLRSNRSLVTFDKEPQFIAHLENLLKKSYPGEDLMRVNLEQLDATPLKYREPFMVLVKRCRAQPTYEFCKEK